MRRARWRQPWAALAGLVGLVAIETAAQARPAAATGRVLLEDRRGQRPVPGAWVTLHRIGRDGAGPVDSVRTDADGRYRIAFAARGDSAARYVATAMRGGVAYPSGTVTPGRDADITVYDTVAADAHVGTASRHIVVSGPDANGVRTIVEVLAIENAGTATLMPRVTGTWRSALPADAQNHRIDDADFAPDAVSFDSGYVRVNAPLAPGIRRLSVSYQLPPGARRVAFHLPDSIAQMELLIDDSLANVSGRGVHEEAPAAAEGRVFRRFAGHDLAGGTTIELALSHDARPRWMSHNALVVGGVIAAMLASLALALSRARSPSPPLAGGVSPD